MIDSYTMVAEEVADAIAEGVPVVALESTIISHGMPYPQNVTTAREVEQVVRKHGAVPATIAIDGGMYRVGVDDELLERLANSGEVAKASRRDLGLILANGTLAATTVATTMIGAYRARIRLFATGGTGGVHRGAETSYDISADLQELARTPVAVVSAGVKSILDIGKTLEYLETVGVPVYGWMTEEFPAFYSRSSGFPVPLVLRGPEEAARALAAQWGAGLTAGALVANPIPAADELEQAYMEEIIARGVKEAEQQQVKGRDLTPFLLARIVQLTSGESLEANIALVKNNATVASQIATALSSL